MRIQASEYEHYQYSSFSDVINDINKSFQLCKSKSELIGEYNYYKNKVNMSQCALDDAINRPEEYSYPIVHIYKCKDERDGWRVKMEEVLNQLLERGFTLSNERLQYPEPIM